MDFVSHRPESRDCVEVTDSMISGYDDPSDWSEDERDDYLAQAPFHLNATRFAATLLLADSQVTFGLLAEVDFFLKDAIDQPYDKTDGIQAREWQVLLPSAAAWISIAGRRMYSICIDDDELIKVDATREVRDKWGARRRFWSRQLWEHWKSRFEILARQENINNECQSLSARAAEKMASIGVEHQACPCP
jgi:hypothetical protein